jgi:formylglycine-generating enzyme required for sulfatase activity
VIGNVWEWVEDCESPSMKAVTEPPADAGNCSARVLRGGSFRTAAQEATLERRRPGGPTVRSAQNGFRIARDL